MNAPQDGEQVPAPALAVVLVTWNVRVLALAALESLFEDLTAQGPPDSQVWLVDNASADGTIAGRCPTFPAGAFDRQRAQPGVRRRQQPGAARHGLWWAVQPRSLPKAVYLLNPDTLTQPGATRAHV